MESTRQKICLSYSNRVDTNFYIFVLCLYFIIVTILFALAIMFYSISNFMFNIAIIMTIVLGITVIITFAKKRKIIKQNLWKNGTKTEGFIVDVGTILYRSTGKGRILF